MEQDYLDKNPEGYCHLSPDLFTLVKELKTRRYDAFISGQEHADWTEIAIKEQKCGAASFKFDSLLPEMNLSLVVQRILSVKFQCKQKND